MDQTVNVAEFIEKLKQALGQEETKKAPAV